MMKIFHIFTNRKRSRPSITNGNGKRPQTSLHQYTARRVFAAKWSKQILSKPVCTAQ